MATRRGSLGSEGARRATGEASEARPERGRFSAKREMAAVLRLLRGEDLDRLSRELRVTAATLSLWREEFLSGGEANLKTGQATAQDEEIVRLKAMIGDLKIRNELRRERARALEANLLWPSGGRGDEPHPLALHGSSLRGADGRRGVGGRAFDGVRGASARVPSGGDEEARSKDGPLSDGELTDLIRGDLAGSPFVGEGNRKVWARLRVAGVRTSLRRVLLLMGEAGLLAPSRQVRVPRSRNHEGTILTERPDEMWGRMPPRPGRRRKAT
jgi:hypothetical protein